jgi:hypothetical protein
MGAGLDAHHENAAPRHPGNPSRCGSRGRHGLRGEWALGFNAFVVPIGLSAAFLVKGLLERACPRCGERFFASWSGLSLDRCQGCGIALGDVPPEIHAARLRWIAGDRAMHAVDARTLEGEERGFRVRITQPSSGPARTVLEANAPLLTARDLGALRAHIRARAPSARVVLENGTARVELAGTVVDPALVDALLEELVDRCASASHGAYR